MALVWQPEYGRYRNTDTGKLITGKHAVGMRNGLAENYGDDLGNLARRYLAGELTESAWRQAFYDTVTKSTSHGYITGRGGVSAMTDADYDRLMRLIDQQHRYAVTFLDDLVARLTEIDRAAQPALYDELLRRTVARSEMYAGPSVEAYERAAAVSLSQEDDGDLELPFYPADGETECMVQCRCSWQIVGTDNEWVCEWITEGDGRVCPGCEQREWQHGQQNPLVIPRQPR